MRMRLVILAALTAITVLAVPALAGAQVVGQNSRDVALGVAADYWASRGMYADGYVDMKFHTIVNHHNVNAYVRYGGTTIHMNSARYWDWDRLCRTTVHEYGHVVGRRHSRSPWSPMYAYEQGWWWDSDPVCEG